MKHALHIIFRTVTIVIYCCVFSAPTLATDYHVSINEGAVNATGSLEAPFATIQHAVNSVNPGDTIFVHAGRYHETVNINSKKGSEQAPITLQAYNNDDVILDGSVLVETLSTSDWTRYDGDIYKIHLGSNISQVFVNDDWSVLARWPNVPNNKDALWSRSYWARGDNARSSTEEAIKEGREYDAGMLVASNLDMTGATAILNLANFHTEAQLVTEHGANNDNFVHEKIPRHIKDVSHYYFFDSKLSLLDAENEWYFDPTTKILYLWQPGGGIPTANTVSVKNITNTLEISDSQYVNVKGINFFSSTFTVNDSSYITVEDSTLVFPVFNKRTLDQRGTIKGTYINNSHHVNILNSEFSYTDGIVLLIVGGHHNRVENSEFHHLDYSVAHFDGINSGSIWYRASPDGIFKRNNIHKTGASEGLIIDSRAQVELNQFYDMAHLQGDGADVHMFQGTLDANIINNWFYQTRKPSIRLSDGPRDSLPAAPSRLLRTGKAVGNVVFEQSADTVAFVVKGDEREIYAQYHCSRFSKIDGYSVS